MNIVWKKPDNTIAITDIYDGSDIKEHAKLLKQRGDVPADWEAIGFDWKDNQFPSENMDSWLWDGSKIIVNNDIVHEIKYANSITPYQFRLAINRLNLRSSVEQAVANGNQDLKDAWEFAPKVTRFDQQTSDIQTALNLTDKQVDEIFDLAYTL